MHCSSLWALWHLFSLKVSACTKIIWIICDIIKWSLIVTKWQNMRLLIVSFGLSTCWPTHRNVFNVTWETVKLFQACISLICFRRYSAEAAWLLAAIVHINVIRIVLVEWDQQRWTLTLPHPPPPSPIIHLTDILRLPYFSGFILWSHLLLVVCYRVTEIVKSLFVFCL